MGSDQAVVRGPAAKSVSATRRLAKDLPDRPSGTLRRLSAVGLAGVLLLIYLLSAVR